MKYPSLSPYSYCGNNVLRYVDADGRVIVDTKGNAILITRGNNGALVFSRNADESTKMIATSLSLTPTGSKWLDRAIKSPTKVHLVMDRATIFEDSPLGPRYRRGQTEQWSLDLPNLGRFRRKDGTWGLKEATVRLYLGSIEIAIEKGSGKVYEGLTLEQAIGAVAGHELVHAVDKEEVNKDIQYGIQYPGKLRPEDERERKPREVARKITDEYWGLNPDYDARNPSPSR